MRWGFSFLLVVATLKILLMQWVATPAVTPWQVVAETESKHGYHEHRVGGNRQIDQIGVSSTLAPNTTAPSSPLSANTPTGKPPVTIITATAHVNDNENEEDCQSSFSIDLTGKQCMGLTLVSSAQNVSDCLKACCRNNQCQIYQWCSAASCGSMGGCWVGSGTIRNCFANDKWQSRSRNPAPKITTATAPIASYSGSSHHRSQHLPQDTESKSTVPVRPSTSDVQVFVFSWKKVEFNALQVFTEVTAAFDDVWLVDCDPSSHLEDSVKKIIKLNDSAYYGQQITASFQAARKKTVVGIIIGDIAPGTRWDVVNRNVRTAYYDWDAGVYAPYESRTHWQRAIGRLEGTDMYTTSNTDSVAWFISPDLVHVFKDARMDLTNFGWGIDVAIIQFANILGHKVVFDKAVTVTNPGGTAYNTATAMSQWNAFSSFLTTSKILPDAKRQQVHFITFGDSQFESTRNRLLNEAKNANFFASVTGYHEGHEDMKDFFRKHRGFIASHPRGYGYWIWKSHAVLAAFNRTNMNDIIVFADVSSKIFPEGSSRFHQYTSLATSNDLVAFKSRYKESHWTKGDVIHELGCNEECQNSSQIMASIFFIRKCPRMIKFVKHWATCVQQDNYHLITDGSSKTSNLPGFQEARYDQSLFSILIKTRLKANIMLLPNEVDPNEPDLVGGRLDSYAGNDSGRKSSFPILTRHGGQSYD